MKKLLILAVIAIAAAAAWYGLNANNRQAASPDTTPTTQQKQNNTASIKPTGENEISIQNFSYSPASLTVKKGKAVKWINQDSVPHTVTESDGKSGPDSPQLAAGQSYSFTFSQTGVFHYRCTLHSNMTGVITVVD